MNNKYIVEESLMTLQKYCWTWKKVDGKITTKTN